MSYLFKRTLIQDEKIEVAQRLAQLKTDAGLSPNARQRQAVVDATSRLDKLTAMLNASDLIDLGEDAALDKNRLIGNSNRIVDVPIDLDFLASKPLFAFLGHSVGLYEHPALLLYYRTTHGGLLCAIDLRIGAVASFAVKDEPRNFDLPPADRALFSELIAPRIIGLNAIQLWPISVRLPREGGANIHGHDMGTTNGIRDAFYSWYLAHVPRHDSFIMWGDPNIGNVSRLTWTEWWNEPI